MREFIEKCKEEFGADYHPEYLRAIKALLGLGIDKKKASIIASDFTIGEPFWILPIGSKCTIREGEGEWFPYVTQKPLVFTEEPFMTGGYEIKGPAEAAIPSSYAL